MVNIKGMFEEGLEKAEKGISDQTKTVAQSVKGQVTGSASSTQSDQGSHEAAQQQAAKANQADQAATKDFVKELYAPSGDGQSSSAKASEGQASNEPSEFVKEQLEAGKTPEEAMQSLRKKLHDEEYYIPLTQRKTHEQEVKEEEQEKEQKKMEDLQTEDEKKKKEQPIAVTMGQNKAEQFPGASG